MNTRLLNSETVRSHSLTYIGGILAFGESKPLNCIVSGKSLSNNFTAFANSIGLICEDAHHYISETGPVALAWPYKDCMIEARMKTYANQQDEAISTAYLSPDENTCSFEPEVLTR